MSDHFHREQHTMFQKRILLVPANTDLVCMNEVSLGALSALYSPTLRGGGGGGGGGGREY